MSQPFWNPELSPDKEPFHVLIKRGDFIDKKRGGRHVPYKIYYPANHGMPSLPVIFWSHGFGGNRDGASFISRFLTAHGYVVVHMTHTGTDSSLWEGKQGHPWDVLKQAKISRETMLSRFQDIGFVFDALEHWAKENPEETDMDFSRVGISGHSMGAMTSEVMAGMLFPDVHDKFISMKESRFKAGILYSPVPIAHLVGEERAVEAYQPITLPLFYMTGTEDDSPIENFGYRERLKIYEESRATEKQLLILQDGDHMVYNGTRGKLAVNPKRGRHEDIIKIGALAFWDMHLKGDEKAKEWLTAGGFAAYIGDDGTYEAQGT